ncbi:MAG: hypothetical protein ACRD4K_11260 [Candidatus Acidiferrales bacterium]
MSSQTRESAFTYEELASKSRGTLNRPGNICRIPVEYVLRTTRPSSRFSGRNFSAMISNS